MRTITFLLVLGIVPPAAARPARREAPRATDLLRAERAAEEARDRLEMPAPLPSGWARGGEWGSAATRRSSQGRGDVHIHLHQGGKAKTRPR